MMVMMCLAGFSQNNFWSANPQSRSSIITDKSVNRQTYPTDIKLFRLNLDPFQQVLLSVVDNKPAKKSTIITVPNAAGGLEAFEVFEASNFEPALQARFPEIRSFSGKGITDRSATLKLSISPQGVQSMVFRSGADDEFIEPYSEDHTIYSVYKAHRQKGKLPWNCTTEDRKLSISLSERMGTLQLAARSGGDLKTMRLAQSVTAEYSNYFGATSASQVSLVLAAINNTLTRCNGVYEKDLALHLNLVAASTNVIYYNPSTDPYSAASTGAGGAWNKELQSTLTAVIGEANYDIGHLFGASGGGGNAGCIGCVCTNGSKGSGFTSPADAIPQGDNFDIDYVVHEVGHQLGGNHTFSMNNEGTGVNKEIGSGITIMGYAGITSQDVAPHSIDVFHEASIAQIQTNLGTKTCPVTTTISNATPVVGALTNYTIPKSTPFALTGSATDANAGDVLTYSWEQNDNASSSQTGTNSVASATKASGPNWLSFTPSTSPTRYFPKLSTILAGGLITGPLPGGDAGANIEALSSVARTLNFRLTVRDNAVYSSTTPVSVGQSQFKDMVVTVSSASGPFAVSSPNTALSWAGNSSQNITWAVASTTATPVSCADVKISLSTDGGQTFPTVLAATTPNDGSEVLTIPNTATTTARIKVEAADNIFFDISNTNFTITAGTGCNSPAGLASSAITTTGATVSWTAVGGAVSYDVDYKLTSSGTWTNAATATTATSVNLSGLTSSTVYDWRVRTNCSTASSAYAAAQFTTAGTATCDAPTALTSSAITTSGATLSWAAAIGANSYAVDYKLTSSATWTSAATATTTTSITLSSLSASSTYDWRVSTTCTSGTSIFATAQFTTATPTTGCQSTLDNSTNGTISGAATIPFNTDVSGLISPRDDIDNYKFVINTAGTITATLTTLPGNYDLKLLNSAGTQVAISKNGSTNNETINYTAAAGTYYAQVFPFKNANSATSCYTLKVQLGTATRGVTETLKAPIVSIYPNPVSNMLKINMGGYSEPVTLTVTDMFGRRMLNKTFSGGSNISTGKFAAGVYLVTIIDKNGVVIKQDKIVKE